jgi:hypothetical protein
VHDAARSKRGYIAMPEALDAEKRASL